MVQLCKHPTQMAHLNSLITTHVLTAGPAMVSQFIRMSILIVSYVTHGLQEMVQNNHPKQNDYELRRLCDPLEQAQHLREDMRKVQDLQRR